jgi:hypothetical protein
MGALKDTLLDTGNRSAVVADCVQLVDDEVASKKGITGAIIKGGYKAFKKLKPGIVKDAVDHLLDKFVEVLDDIYADYLKAEPAKKKAFDTWAGGREKQIANELLGVTDAIINGSDKTVIKKIYGGLRKTAEKNVMQAVPGISRLIIKYAN